MRKLLLPLLLLSPFSAALAQPVGITQEMINTTLPEEGAPKAVPGAYAVTSEPAFGNAGLVTFRPSSLERFPRQDTLPVVVWGHGGCAMNAPANYGFLETVASHGFLVITTAGAADATPAGGRPRQATADDLKAGLDWAEKENAREGSPLRGRIDTQRMAAMGQSCGGILAVALGLDARVDTILVFNAGVDVASSTTQPGRPTIESLKDLHGPVLLVNGHERDFQMQASRATFDAITHVPAFYGARQGAGHTATLRHKGGGEFANVASAWLRWQFKGDQTAAKLFVGERCGLCTDPDWETASKLRP
jgi:predicted alpha/beta-hydrolase family hydrolase